MLLQTFTVHPLGDSTSLNTNKSGMLSSKGVSNDMMGRILFITFLLLLSLFLFSEFSSEAYDSHIYQFFTTSWDSTIFTLTDIQS